MRPLNLKNVLAEHQIPQAALARAVGFSPGAIAQMINYGQWPKGGAKDQLQTDIVRFLADKIGKDAVDVAGIFKVADEGGNPHQPDNAVKLSEESMLMQKQGLQPEACEHFNLKRDPFAGIRCDDDVFLYPKYREMRELLLADALGGGWRAVIGESGCGKSTLIDDLHGKLAREAPHAMMIRPYVLGMEDNDKAGKRLSMPHIAEAIKTAIAPTAKLCSSPQARFAQLHELLKDRYRSNGRTVVVIDEAHRLPTPTLKQLKGLHELKIGHTPLVAILLTGQPELHIKLNPYDHAVREVTQRCDVSLFPRLVDDHSDHLDDYVTHVFARAGGKAADVLTPCALLALRKRLTVAQKSEKGRDGQFVSLLYPLAINNFLARVMTMAARVGASRIDAAFVEGV